MDEGDYLYTSMPVNSYLKRTPNGYLWFQSFAEICDYMSYNEGFPGYGCVPSDAIERGLKNCATKTWQEAVELC